MTTVGETATLAWGYTMAEIDGMAHLAARARASGLIDDEEAIAVAWHAIVVALYEADEEPSRYEVVRAGMHALRQEKDKLRSFYGIGSYPKGGGERAGMPKFHTYWGVRLDGDDGFSERIVERLALPAVLSVLTPKQYEAISTLAAFNGDRHEAAAALGLTVDGLDSRLRFARRILLALWLEGETPRRKKPVEGMCRAGHPRAEHSVRDSYNRWKCVTCQRGYSRRATRRYRERDREAAALDGSGELD